MSKPDKELEAKWPATMDAVKWAEAFEEHKQRNGWTVDDIDEGLMLAWFANAIMAGYDKAKNE